LLKRCEKVTAGSQNNQQSGSLGENPSHGPKMSEIGNMVPPPSSSHGARWAALTPHLRWAFWQRARVSSEVLPPAPHVTSTNIGLLCGGREAGGKGQRGAGGEGQRGAQSPGWGVEGRREGGADGDHTDVRLSQRGCPK